MARSLPLQRGASVLALFVAAAFGDRDARAGGPSPSELSLTNDMLKDAIEAEAAGKCGDALEILKQVVAIKESAAAYQRIGQCLGKTGKARDGQVALLKAVDLAQKENDKSGEAAALASLNALREAGPSLSLKVPADAKRVAVSLDGVVVSQADLDHPILVEPGEHRVEAHADARRPFSQKINVSDRGKTVVEIVVPPEAATSPPPAAPLAPKAFASTIPLGAWIAGSAAVALVAGGAIAFAVAGSTASDGRSQCATQVACDPSTVSSVHQLDAAALGMWIGAGAFAGAAVTLYVLENRSSKKELALGSRRSRSSWLTAGPSSVGVAGVF